MNANRIDTLLNLPYNELLSQLEDIMEQRARSLQPQKANVYYNFLYALHIKYDNFRKGGANFDFWFPPPKKNFWKYFRIIFVFSAARVMFEQAYRSDDNKQQMISYSMCVNCLSLVNPNHAWMLKPKPASIIEDEDEVILQFFKSLPRNFDRNFWNKFWYAIFGIDFNSNFWNIHSASHQFWDCAWKIPKNSKQIYFIQSNHH